MGVSEITDLLRPFVEQHVSRKAGRFDLFLLSDVLGAGESQAEGEGGAGETAGSAGALQEVFDLTQHSLGQGSGQRAHAEVTSEPEPLSTAKPCVPLHEKHLKEAVVSCDLSVFLQAGWIQRFNFGERLLKIL